MKCVFVDASSLKGRIFMDATGLKGRIFADATAREHVAHVLVLHVAQHLHATLKKGRKCCFHDEKTEFAG